MLNMCCVLSHSVGSDSVTPWIVAHQAPLSMGFSRQEYWSGSLFSSPGGLPNPGIELSLQYCRQILYHLGHQGSPGVEYKKIIKYKFDKFEMWLILKEKSLKSMEKYVIIWKKTHWKYNVLTEYETQTQRMEETWIQNRENLFYFSACGSVLVQTKILSKQNLFILVMLVLDSEMILNQPSVELWVQGSFLIL